VVAENVHTPCPCPPSRVTGNVRREARGSKMEISKGCRIYLTND